MSRGARIQYWLALAVLLLALAASCAPRLSYAAGRIFAAGFEGDASGGAELPCSDLNPAGWTRVHRSWTRVFSAPDGHPSAAYPGSVSFPTPIGSDIGVGVVVPITPYAFQGVNLYFDQVQSRPQDGYFKARYADAMFVGLTDCKVTVNGSDFPALDLRPPVPMSPDPMRWPACRLFENSGSLVWTTGTAPGGCHLDPTRRYGLVIAPINPVTLQHSCAAVPNSAQGCDVGAVTQSGVVP
ncbi:MAG: hypothetical protein M3Q42_05280 [Pseudomonadota bacterium]|nr:hypothetical protein [Pseudomonadota bacterium]